MLTNRQLFLRHVAQTSDEPFMLEIERAEGVYLYDPEGKEYIDLIAGISVSNLGHCHPRVVAAVQQQVAKYMHLMVYGEYVHYPQVKLSQLLCSLLPAQLDNVYLVNSGAEAAEGALKLAKRYTGRTEMIGFQNSYHGSTHGALSLIGDEYFRQAYRPLLPDVRHLPYNQIEGLAQITTRTACVIAEPIQAESGVTVPNRQFIQVLRKRCTEVGALLILDEIQTGFGRTGSFFAFEQFDIVPDILLLAKGMGGGMPIGAFVANREVMQTFTNNPYLGHITTFGGHPVCCAAAIATIQTLMETNYITEVKAKEALFHELLQHPLIHSIQSMGLLMAIHFENAQLNQAVVDLCATKGILTDWFLFADHCLRIAPPLIITEAEIKKVCAILLACIDEVDNK